MSEDRITDLERQLEYARALAREAHEATLVTMSHELRTPMHTILGLTEDLIAQGMTAEQRGLLERVRANAEHLRSLLDDFLDLARIDSGSLTLADQPFDPREIVEQAIELATPAAQRKRIELLSDIDPAIPLFVGGDARRTAQVVSNLIGNAVKYTRRGEIEVLAYVHEDREAYELRISVRDSGVGISEADRARIFERFVRVGQQGEAAGTGLGLALVRSIVTQCGGTVSVESEIGEGSTFSVAIPMRRLTDDESPNARYFGKMVGVVAKSAEVRAPIARLLVHEGADVVEAGTYEELERVRDAPLAALLVDAGVSDASALARARSVERDPVPLLVLTAFEDEGIGAVKALQGSAFLVRPVRKSKLLARVDRMLGIAKRESGSTARPREESASKVRPRALLVEDDRDNRQLLRRTFSRLGYAVTAVEDGEIGLERAKSFEYDVVVADVMMPRRNGPDMAAAIRAHEATTRRRNVPIIAVTANAFEATREECERAGMNAFLRKPLVASELEQVLAMHVDARAAVLVVDDSPESRTLIGYFLDTSRVRVVEASSGHAALEAAEQQRIDLVLMDLEMPGMDGFELCAALRATQSHVETPILAVTAHDDPQIHRRCMEIGFTDILVKPVGRVTLRKAVERYVPSPRLVDPNAPPTEQTPRKDVRSEDVAYVESDILDLVPQFLESRRSDVAKLREALAAGDRTTMRRIGHGMRGSGGGYGFHAVTRFGGDLEDAAPHGSEETLARTIDALAHYLEHVRVEVRRD